MPIIDQELFVRCRTCGSEAATGVRRTEEALSETAAADRRVTCARCGAVHRYEAEDFYHRSVESDRERTDV